MSDETEFFVDRPGYYVRKRDGARVRVADWPDGDVSWILDPMPLIAAHFAGTCSAKTFERNHTKLHD